MRHSLLRAAFATAVVAGFLMLTACSESPTSSTHDAQAPSDPLMQAGPNNAPSAVIAVQDFGLVEGKSVVFHGAGSTDPDIADRPTLTYIWIFGDGTLGHGRFTSHTYIDNGTYTVSLIVADMHGASTTASVAVAIKNANPSPGMLTLPILLFEGVGFRVSLNNATDLGVVDYFAGFEYSFDCGDARWSGWSRNSFRDCEGPRDNGNYTIRGRVRDKDGGAKISRTTVKVLNSPPACLMIFDRPAADQIRLSATCNDVSSPQITIAVNWGDGGMIQTVPETTGSPIVLVHHFEPGTYTVSVKATDKDGGVFNATPYTSNIP